MGIDYDAWLVQPYEEQAEWESLCEQYMDSQQYQDDLAEWLDENEGKTEKDYQDSNSFTNGVEAYQSRYDDRYDDWDGDRYDY